MMASTRPSDPPEPVAPAPVPTPAADGLPPSGFVLGFDWVLAFGVLVLAFFVGSFSIRNSDFWMHLATGRLIAGGEYSFGTDPFSYATGGQRWVNHEWLYDWGVYQVFKAGEGQAVVIAKCLALVLAAGLLLLTRRPGESAFPYVVATGLALLAAAPRMAVQPQVASVLLLAAFMYALARVPKRAGTWTFPAVVGGLFCVWANVDQWFFIGPGLLALYAAGQFIRRDPDTDPTTVLKALGIGVVACCLNPHHIHVWELPGELAGGQLEQVFKDDPELGPLFRSGLDPSAWDFDANPANPGAMIGLLVLAAAGFALNYRHLSVGLALAWGGAAVLAGWHLRAIPFLAVVTAPVAAANLVQASARLAARPIPEGTARALGTIQATGRFAVGLGGLLLIAISYAGWLHPFATQRRWKWELEPVVSNQRAAEQIHAWRESGALPKEARVLNLQPDMASYIAWFAPGQQTFFDYRLNLLAPRAEEFAGVRRQLTLRTEAEVRQDQFDFPAFLRNYQVVYAVTAHQSRRTNQIALAVLWRGGQDSDWALWAVTGRAVLLGWEKQTAVPKAAVADLRFDPPRAAFVDPRPLPEPVAPDTLHPPFRPVDVWDKFVAAPPLSPADGEEVLVLDQYRESRMAELINRHRYLLDAPGYFLLRLYMPRPGDQTGGRKYFGLTPALQDFLRHTTRYLPVEYPVEVNAVSLLAVRAGRRAVVASPDHPDGYYFLAKAYQDPGYLTFPDIRMIVTSANFARCLARLPADPTKQRVTIDVQEACQRLFAAHMEATPPRLDLALECRRLATDYLRLSAAEIEADANETTDDALRKLREQEATRLRQQAEQIQRRIAQDEQQLKTADNTFVNSVANVASPVERAAVARRVGLVNTAIQELEKAHQQTVNQLTTEADRAKLTPLDLAMYAAVHTELIELLLFAGRAEDAVAILDALDTDANLAVLGDPKSGIPDQHYRIRRAALGRLFPGPQRPPESPYDADPVAHIRSLRQVVSLAVGQFEKAVQAQTADASRVRAALDGFVQRTYPQGPPKLADLGEVDVREDMARLSMMQLGVMPLPLNPGVLAVVQGGIMTRFYGAVNVQQYINFLQGRVDAHARLALTYLEMGKIEEAVHHFTQAVEGPEPPTGSATQRIAKTYLKVINQARGGKK